MNRNITEAYINSEPYLNLNSYLKLLSFTILGLETVNKSQIHMFYVLCRIKIYN